MIIINDGSDTVLYGRGDNYDLVRDDSGAVAERDVLKFTDLNRGRRRNVADRRSRLRRSELESGFVAGR